jgi:hypothetical protein
LLKDYKVGKAYEYFSSGWLQEVLKDKVEQKQLVYFKNKVFTITDTGWWPPQCIDIVPKKMMVRQKSLNIIEMYWFIDTMVTTTFCHEFVRNISAKIIHHWLQSLLLLSNGPELALHRHDREFKKNMHKFHQIHDKML